ncbi:MAG: helix-hairpin-helix domain-containing protein [Catonella sp.]
MKSRLQLIVVLLFVGIAGLIFVFSGKNVENPSELEVVESEEEQEISKVDINSSVNEKTELQQEEIVEKLQSKIFVHICGEVKKEGVYQVESDARIVDAINAAGGLTNKAASYGINQAEKLKDGMQIYVPSKKEIKKEIEKTVRNGQALPISSSQRSSSENVQGDLININFASKEELMKIKGVGEAKAVLIINYRETNGSFKNITDLMKIKGIKQKFFDKIKDNICV